MAKPIPDEQAALLGACVAHPDDDTARLVYADWLHEHGDEEQAQFIRDSIKLASMKPRAKGRMALANRLKILAESSGDRWLTKLGVPIVKYILIDYTRGLVEGAYFSQPVNFHTAVDRLFRVAPIRRLNLNSFSYDRSDPEHAKSLRKL